MKIFLIFLLSLNLYAFNLETFINNSIDKGKEIYYEYRQVQNIEKEQVNINSLFVKKYINEKNCDQILGNNGYFTTCYDYNLKSAIYGYAKIDGKLVNENNLKERPNFYIDKKIPKKYQSEYNDYTNTGFDRSHQFSDASFDWEKRPQLSTYVMSNILPHYPNTNRKTILSVEKYERLVAEKLGNVEVLIIHKFPKNPQRIGRNKIAVPEAMIKVFWNTKYHFQKCFYIPNDDKVYSLKQTVIDCQKVI